MMLPVGPDIYPKFNL